MKLIEIGRSGKKPVYIDLETLLRTRLLGQANSGGGKSWAARRLAEQLFGHVPIHIVDPEDEFSTLREKFGFVLAGKGGELSMDPRHAGVIAHKMLELRASVIFNLYELKPAARHQWVKLYLEALVDSPKTLWRPTVIMIDEAHVFCPEKGQGESVAFGAVQDLVTRGRKRGFCPILWTQRLSKLSKNVSAEMLNRLVGMTFEDVDLDRAGDLLSVSREDRSAFRAEMKGLEPGSFYGLGRAISKDRVMIKIGPVQTTHPEMGTGNVEPPPSPEKIRPLLPKLKDLPQEAEAKLKTEADLRQEIRGLKAQLAARPTPPPAAPRPVSQGDLKVVEVPIMGKRDMNRLEKLVERVEEAKKAYWGTTTSLENATRDMAAALTRLRDGKSTNELRKSVGLAALKNETYPAVGKYAARALAASTGTTRPLSFPASVTSKIEMTISDANLGKCERGILTVLAQHPDGCEIGKVALLSGYTRTSGSFSNSLGSLRTKGYLEGDNSSIMRITGAGALALGDVDPLPAGPDLARYWLGNRIFGACERRILEALLSNPDGLTIDEVAEQSGYARGSGSFSNALGALRTAGVLIGKNSEKMRPAEALV